jgi:WD40 repeat protein
MLAAQQEVRDNFTRSNVLAILARRNDGFDRQITVRTSDRRLLIDSLTFNSAGTRIAAATNRFVVKSWQMDGWTDRFPEIESERGAIAFGWSEDGSLLYAAHLNGRIDVWNPQGWQLVQRLSTTEDEPLTIDGMALTPDGDVLTWSGRSDSARLWLEGGTSVLSVPHEWDIDAGIVVRRAGGADVPGEPDRTEFLLNAEPDEENRNLVYRLDRATLQFQPVQSWEDRRPRRLKAIPGTEQFVWIEERRSTAIRRSPDDGSQFVMGDHGRLAFGNPEAPSSVKELEAHRGQIFDVVVSADGLSAVTVGADQQWSLWDVRTRKALLSAKVPQRGDAMGCNAHFVAISGDGTAIAVLNSLFELMIWNRSGALIQRIDLFPDPPIQGESLSFSPDGKHLVIGQLNGIVRVLSRVQTD